MTTRRRHESKGHKPKQQPRRTWPCGADWASIWPWNPNRARCRGSSGSPIRTTRPMCERLWNRLSVVSCSPSRRPKPSCAGSREVMTSLGAPSAGKHLVCAHGWTAPEARHSACRLGWAHDTLARCRGTAAGTGGLRGQGASIWSGMGASSQRAKSLALVSVQSRRSGACHGDDGSAGAVRRAIALSCSCVASVHTAQTLAPADYTTPRTGRASQVFANRSVRFYEGQPRSLGL